MALCVLPFMCGSDEQRQRQSLPSERRRIQPCCSADWFCWPSAQCKIRRGWVTESPTNSPDEFASTKSSQLGARRDDSSDDTPAVSPHTLSESHSCFTPPSHHSSITGQEQGGWGASGCRELGVGTWCIMTVFVSLCAVPLLTSALILGISYDDSWACPNGSLWGSTCEDSIYNESARGHEHDLGSKC